MHFAPRLLRTILMLLVAVAGYSGQAVAQDVVSTSGTMGLMEGRHYMVAFPQVWASTSEVPTPKPMLLFISSRSRATVTITTPAPSNDAIKLSRTITLQPDEVFQFEVPIPLMNTESEVKSGYGIAVTGDKPISVSTYQAWMGNGELARHLPVESWGRNYYSMNFYQDRYGQNGNYKYRPGQILVIAARDNTVVTYTPTVDTEGGRDQPSVRKGQTGTVTLNKGETFLIKAKIDEAYNKEYVTDLSGTWIRASRPVGVVSGHTKVAIMRYPDVLPPTGMFATEAHFVRNNVHDAMLPFEMAGTEFVTIPVMYGPLRITGKAAQDAGIEDDRGDVIRFIALEDGTQIEALREDGSDYKTIMKIDRGGTWLETSVQVPTKWRSNKPMLVGHYGKAYAKVIPPAASKDGDATQGHPTVESGMPMLQYVPSTDRWVSYAVFHAPDGMDNFFNIVFRPEEVGKIKFNGASLNGRFGGAMRELKGTPYWYIRHPIGKGDYVIESETEDVRWMAWSYGSLDGLNMGRAYGTPVAVDVAIECDDSVAVTEEILCGDVKGEGKILPEGSECGSIYMIYAESLSNYELVVDENFESGMQKAKFQVNVLDKRQPGKAVVRVVSRSGKYVEKTYEYTPDKIDWSPKSIDFGAIPIGSPSCKTITFTNLRTDAPVTVKDVRVKYYPGTFRFNPASFTIDPGQSVNVEVCATTNDTRELVDTVIAQLECFDEITTELRVRSQAPLIYVGDQTWINIPATSPGVERPVEIINASDVNLTITGYDKTLLDGSGNFFNPRNLDEVLPLTIAGGGRHTFYVTYSPRGEAGVAHQVNVPFYSNAKKEDSIAVLKGNGVEIDLYAAALPWNVRVLDNIQTAQGVTSYGQTVEFQNTGDLPVEFSTPEIRGADAASFRIVDFGNTGGFPITLVGGTRPSATINIEFVPTELANRGGERNDYTAELVFPTNSDAQREIVVELKGTAWQPQVKGADQDYGIFNLGAATSTLDIPVSNTHFQDVTNPTTGDAQGTHEVVITGINIVGAANNFKINNGPTPASPWRLAGGEERMLNVTFDPRESGMFSAQYEIITQPENLTTGAAPYTPVYTLTAEVIGGEFNVRDAYARQYVLNTTEMVVEVRHSEAQPRTYDVSFPKGADASRFTVIEPASGVLTVAPGQTGVIRIQFGPDFVTLLQNGQNRDIIDSKGGGSGIKWRDTPAGQPGFVATIDITDQVNGETKTASITGDGLFLETTNFVGQFVDGAKKTGYTVKPGEAVQVAVSLEAVPESLDPVKLTEMRVRLSWDPKLVQPRTNPADFILDGMLAEGWTVVNVATFPEGSRMPNSMEIDIADLRATKTPLVNDRTKPFFAVIFDAYLGIGADPVNVTRTPVNVYSYTVDFDGSNGPGVTQSYALFNDEPGSITVDFGCAGELRLVQLSSTTFGVKPVSPNPVSSTATINYSIGLNGHTSIVLYNYAGERIMDILDANQASGTYEIALDVSTLPAGTYYYRVVSGPFMSEPQSMTIVR